MAQDVWHEIRDKVEGLGLKLKLHLEQEADEGDATAETPGTAETTETTDTAETADTTDTTDTADTTETSDTRAALEEMGDKLQDALNSFGNAAKDPAVRADMKEIGVLLRDAIMSSVSNVAGEAERVLKKTKGEMEDEIQAESGEDGDQA